jgi:hypothetical protein
LGFAANLAPLHASKLFPFRQRDTRLSKNDSQQILPNVASVGIWNPHTEMVFDHELVFSTGIRTTKTELAEAAN